MANRSLFRSLVGKLLPKADTRNEEGGPAYRMPPKHALAQYAATGCLHTTFYATESTQLEAVLRLCGQVDADFIARTALYGRTRGAMKDMPALLCAVLSVQAPALFERVFERVIDNGRMLRTFVQIMRSGAVERISLGSRPKRQVRHWLATRSDEAVVRASVGTAPSLADIVKMVHPKAATPSREALYGWLIGREVARERLPGLVREFEHWKATREGPVPDVPFQMLTALDLGAREWKSIAANAGWQMTRMNLNAFARHGVLTDDHLVGMIAARLRNSDAIEAARAFPYQLLVAYRSAGDTVPFAIREALQDAMEVSIRNVPAVAGKVIVCPDVSGSMASPVTGRRKGATTAVRCIDVAALVAAAFLRKNPEAEVIPFESAVVDIRLNPRDSVLTNAEKLARIGGGGTNCSAPLTKLNREKARGDLVVFVSDNESWVDAGHGRGTATMRGWQVFRARNPEARLVCIDIQPYGTTQAVERPDVLNVGGFSDAVFNVVGQFAAGGLAADDWIGEIERMQL